MQVVLKETLRLYPPFWLMSHMVISGEMFMLTEMHLVLAIISQRYRLTLDLEPVGLKP